MQIGQRCAEVLGQMGLAIDRVPQRHSFDAVEDQHLAAVVRASSVNAWGAYTRGTDRLLDDGESIDAFG